MSPWFVIYLGIAHWVADFLLQNDWMAVNKSKRWDALIAHTMVYSFAMAMFTLSGWFGLVTFGLHFATDATTSRMTRALFPWSPSPSSQHVYIDYDGDPAGPWGLGLRRSRHWFFTVIGADQWVLHWPQLVLTAYYLL